MKGVCSLSMASAKGVTKLDGRDVLEMILLVLFLHESTGFMGDLIVHILKTGSLSSSSACHGGTRLNDKRRPVAGDMFSGELFRGVGIRH